MNVAELTAVLAFLSGAISAPVYAVGTGAPWWAIFLSAIWGVVFGVIVAFVAGKVAFWLLMDRSGNKIISGIKFIGYMLWPIPAIGLSILGSIAATSLAIR
ncbi:MAG: ABC-type uncharacterized transport system permease subunit [Candidatus Binatia bacterium]|jgi:ABC-type uncharacterized transport system permease subunit